MVHLAEDRCCAVTSLRIGVLYFDVFVVERGFVFWLPPMPVVSLWPRAAIARRLLLPVAQSISMVKAIEAALQSHVTTIAGSLAAILRDHASTILAIVNDAKVLVCGVDFPPHGCWLVTVTMSWCFLCSRFPTLHHLLSHHTHFFSLYRTHVATWSLFLLFVLS